MALFTSNNDFIQYIFSLRWENKNHTDIECFPIGIYALSDLVSHLEMLSNDVLIALNSDIMFAAEKKRMEELKLYPQEFFGYLYEESLEEDNLKKWIENNFPVVDFVWAQIETKLKPGYIDPEPTDQAEGWKLPSELDTDRARKYIARAVEVGYITRTNIGYKWVMGGARGALARLGYFVMRVYCPNNTEQLPESAINKLFGVSRIASAITQLCNAKKPQKWRAEIDNNIFYD